MSRLKWDKDFALEQAADDNDLLQELIEIFKDSLKADVALIDAGLAEESASKVCGAAHSIKGAAQSLGINGISDIAREIEEDSREGGIAVAKNSIDTLKELMSEVFEL